MKFFTTSSFLTSTIIFLSATFQACSPVPRHELSSEEKVADMYWIYSQFNENYAPLEYKENKYSFKFEELKKEYLEKAQNTKTNEEFYSVMYDFVSRFEDAHTAGSLTQSDLPGRTNVAFLGFNGKRNGNSLEVTELLPTFANDPLFPVKVGDQILKINGDELPAVVTKQFLTFRNTGSSEANLTYHMNKIFNRVSISNPMPTDQNAKLLFERTIDGNKKQYEVTLPWVVKDLISFSKEQSEAKKSNDAKNKVSSENIFEMGLLAIKNNLNFIPEIFLKINHKLPKYDFLNTFEFVDDSPTVMSPVINRNLIAFKKALDPNLKINASEETMKELKMNREVPKSVFLNAAVYPTYITNETMLNKDGTKSSALVATMYLNTFSPPADEDPTVADVKEMLAMMKQLGVKKIIIDMINNGGGSLSLGVKLAQLFSNKKLILPDMQFKLSDTWLDEFDNKSTNAPSDAQKEINRRIFEQLKNEKAAGRDISTPITIEALMPFAVVANENADPDLKIVLMVNEMCASMCDIFSSIMQDNKLATIVGTTTMGAGGNVVDHQEAPNSHFKVRQTESLIKRSSGIYIENVGVKPEVEISVNLDTKNKYSNIRKKAIEQL